MNIIEEEQDAKNVKDIIPRWTKTSPSLKKRKIPTYAEGIEFGLKPKIDNLSQIFQRYVEANYTMVRNKAIMHTLEAARDVNGEPILFSEKGLNTIVKTRKKEIEAAKKEGLPDEFIKNLEDAAKDYSFNNYKRFFSIIVNK